MICKNTKIGKFRQIYTKAKTGRHKWMAKSIRFTDLKICLHIQFTYHIQSSSEF